MDAVYGPAEMRRSCWRWEGILHGRTPARPHGPNHQELSRHTGEALGLSASLKPFFLLAFVPLSPLVHGSRFRSTA